MGGKRRADPCRTPGAIYETVLDSSRLSLSVIFPRPVIAELTAEEKEKLITKIHDATVNVIETLYTQVWAEVFADKPLEGHDGNMPRHHYDL